MALRLRCRDGRLHFRPRAVPIRGNPRAIRTLRPRRHPGRAANATAARARRASSTSAACWSGAERDRPRRRGARRQRLRDRDAARDRRGADADDRPDRPHGRQPRRARRGRRAARPPRLRRRRRSSCRRAGTVLDPAAMPALAGKAGEDIVTSSGDTLLGADDKAGVAEIMTAVAHLAAHPELPRPNLRIAFTPDEEIGMGASLFDVEAFGAQLRVHDRRLDARRAAGRDLHRRRGDHRRSKGSTSTRASPPASWSTPPRLAARIVAELPDDSLSPETTSGREGFIHVYEMSGDRRVGADPRDRPRLRRRPAGRARRAAARDRRAGGGGGADREG